MNLADMTFKVCKSSKWNKQCCPAVNNLKDFAQKMVSDV